MTLMTPTIAALSEAQKNAIMHGKCGLPRFNEEWTADCICSASPATDELVRIGLAYRRERFPHGVVLTDEGRKVRQHLLEGKDA